MSTFELRLKIAEFQTIISKINNEELLTFPKEVKELIKAITGLERNLKEIKKNCKKYLES